MKRHRLIISTLLAATAITISAGINSPDATGYSGRARLMFADRNYTGCTDQSRQLKHLHPTPLQTEEAGLLTALSALHTPGREDAAQMLEEWIASYPSSPWRQTALAAVADFYFTRGEYVRALEGYNRVDTSTLSDTGEEDVIYRRSYCYLMLAEFDRAREGFTYICVPGNRYYKADLFYLGYMAYAEGDYTTAMKFLPLTLDEPELGPAAEYYIAQIEFAQGNYEKALSRALAALKSDAVPQFAPEANRIAGESLFNLGRQDEAVGYLRKYASATESPVPSAFYILGVSEYRLGNYDEAIAKLSRVAGCDDAMGQSANLFLGQSYVTKGNTDGALMAFEKAYRMGYDRDVAETALYNYAVAKSQGGRVPFGSSVALFEGFLRQYPDSRYASSVQDYIVSGYLTDNDYESVVKAVDAMRNPSAEALDAKQRALFSLGTRDYAAQRFTTALQRFEAAARTGSDADIRRQSLLWQGNCLYDLDRYDRAVKAFEQYIKSSPSSDPNMALARYDLGYARFAAGDYKGALADFRRLIDMRPDNPGMIADATNRAADCLYYQSDFDGAAQLYEKAYSLNPESGDYALYQLAVMKGLGRDHKAKIAGIDNLIERYPSSGLIPAAMLEKAESYAAMSDNRSAISVYTDLVNRYPSSAYARKGLLQLAITYRSAGRGDSAVEAYRSVIEKYPTSEEARVAADDLKRIYADEGRLGEFTAFMSSIPDAPQTDPSELDALAFRAAEADYINNDRTERLEQYLRDYPRGVHEPQALYLLAEAAAASGNTDSALELSTRLTTSHPDAAAAEDALLIKADAERQQGKGRQALDTYRNLESRATSTRTLQQARLGVMRTAAELADFDTALDAADKLLATSAAGLAETNEVRFTRALALSRLGRTQEAVEIWSALAEDPADIYGSRSAVSLAETYLAAGDSDKARETADRLINANPPHQYWLARGFIVLSDALRARGETFEADEYLRSLRSNYPGTETEIFEMIDSRLNSNQ